MAKELLVGQNGNQRTTDFYTWQNGTMYRVVEGYVWHNGTMYQFYGAGGSLVENFWFFYKTANDDTLVTVINNVGDRPYIYKKFTSSITFYALISPSSYGNMYGDVLVLSTDSTGIRCGRTTYIGDTGSLTYNGITWYYGFCTDKTYKDPYSVDPSGCKLPSYPDATTERTQGIQDVLAKIYADDFAENYQVGNSYNLVKADMEKTIRKFIAMYLFLNVALKESYNYPTAYELICTHVEDIVDYFLGSKGNNDIISLNADYSLDGTGLAFLAYYSNSSLSNIGIDYYTPSSSNDGYDCYTSDDQITYNSWVKVQFKGDGTIDYGTPTSIQSNEYIAIGKSGYGIDYMELSNIGLSYQTVQHTIQPEYDYQAGQTYTIHANIKIADLIEATKKLFFDYGTNIGGLFTRPSVIYLRDHWLDIKTAILAKITQAGLNFTSITMYLSYRSSANNCVIEIRLGTSSFPQQIGIDSVAQDPAGNNYYYLSNSPSRPSSVRYFSATINSDSYTVGNMVAISGYHQHIGIYVQSTSNNYNVEGSNYGMKRT